MLRAQKGSNDMSDFFWSRGPEAGGSSITMILTVVPNTQSVQVTSRMGIALPVPGFSPCLATSQSLAVGPVPGDFLPMTAHGLSCPQGATPSRMLMPADSPAPTDAPGVGPFCSVLNSTPPTLTCLSAQRSGVLDAARSSFNTACVASRADAANQASYSSASSDAAAIAGALIGGAVAALAVPVYGEGVAALLVFLAVFFALLTIWFAALAAQAAASAGEDESRMLAAQNAFQQALNRIRTVCCPDWIYVNENDLTCP
jgi:hypothetical protein